MAKRDTKDRTKDSVLPKKNKESKKKGKRAEKARESRAESEHDLVSAPSAARTDSKASTASSKSRKVAEKAKTNAEVLLKLISRQNLSAARSLVQDPRNGGWRLSQCLWFCFSLLCDPFKTGVYLRGVSVSLCSSCAHISFDI